MAWSRTGHNLCCLVHEWCYLNVEQAHSATQTITSIYSGIVVKNKDASMQNPVILHLNDSLETCIFHIKARVVNLGNHIDGLSQCKPLSLGIAEYDFLRLSYAFAFLFQTFDHIMLPLHWWAMYLFTIHLHSEGALTAIFFKTDLLKRTCLNGVIKSAIAVKMPCKMRAGMYRKISWNGFFHLIKVKYLMEIAVWEKTYTYIPFTDFYQYY